MNETTNQSILKNITQVKTKYKNIAKTHFNGISEELKNKIYLLIDDCGRESFELGWYSYENKFMKQNGDKQ